MKGLLALIVILALLAGTGTLAFRHFVTNSITDKGGMENPYILETEYKTEDKT